MKNPSLRYLTYLCIMKYHKRDWILICRFVSSTFLVNFWLQTNCFLLDFSNMSYATMLHSHIFQQFRWLRPWLFLISYHLSAYNHQCTSKNHGFDFWKCKLEKDLRLWWLVMIISSSYRWSGLMLHATAGSVCYFVFCK